MRLLVYRYFVFLGAAACAQGGKNHVFDDAPPPPIDAAAVDAPPDQASPDASNCPMALPAGPHLVLSEVSLGPATKEFIEITNPTGAAVDLSNYYLSDNGAYWKLPMAIPNLGAADFIVKFPAGATIPANGVVTVATDTAASFNTAYAMMPTYSIADASVTVVATNGTPTLTDAGEIVVLFTWDGTAPLVFDVDVMLVGVPTAANGIVTKSLAMQKGCKYAADANTIAVQASAPGAGKSTKRLALEGAAETHAGGNGLTGDDETSENTAMTWDTTATFTAPTPGTVPTALTQ
jgi:hypothetical protein